MIGRRLFSPEVGLLAGVILATSVMFEMVSHAATPDASLIFCSTAGLMVFVLTTFKSRTDATVRTAPAPRFAGYYFCPTWLSAAALYAVLGVGLLAKGPVGLILPTAVIGMYLLIVNLPACENPNRSTSWIKRAKEKIIVLLFIVQLAKVKFPILLLKLFQQLDEQILKYHL